MSSAGGGSGGAAAAAAGKSGRGSKSKNKKSRRRHQSGQFQAHLQILPFGVRQRVGMGWQQRVLELHLNSLTITVANAKNMLKEYPCSAISKINKLADGYLEVLIHKHDEGDDSKRNFKRYRFASHQAADQFCWVVRALRKHGGSVKRLFGNATTAVTAARIHSKVVAKRYPNVPVTAVREVLVSQCGADADQVMPDQFLRLMVQLDAVQAEQHAAAPKASRAVASRDQIANLPQAGTSMERDAALFEATGELLVHADVQCALRAQAMDMGVASVVSVHGTLKWTTFRVLFRPFSDAGGLFAREYVSIPLMSINRVRQPQPHAIVVDTKNFQTYNFTFDQDPATVRQFFNLFQQRIHADFFNNPASLYAFSFEQQMATMRDRDVHGGAGAAGSGGGGAPASGSANKPSSNPAKHEWVYSIGAEFRRQGALHSKSCWQLLPNSKWMIPTYPRSMLLPERRLFNLAEVEDTAAFRSKKRIPAITWVHPCGAVLARCSMPLVGLAGLNCVSDEKLIEIYRRRGLMSSSDDTRRKVYIVDARPKLNTTATHLTGGGGENMARYKHSKLVQCGIENIHKMRDALTSMLAASQAGEIGLVANPTWLSSLDASLWLEYNQTVLAAAVNIARLMEGNRCSVVVHCSDGWDRTAQLCALAQLLMDPFYRTIDGFAVLVEKDWCSFGHKFHDRLAHGHACSNKKDSDALRFFKNTKEASPIFLQFLEVTWLILRQFPTFFEFNEACLIYIADSSYSCRYGNFLYNSVQQRTDFGVYKATRSIWADVRTRPSLFQNPNFHPYKGVLWPHVDARRMVFWENFYMRGSTTPAPLDSAVDLSCTL